MIYLITAYDQNRLIGNGAKLPWDIPEERKHFKNLTIGKNVVMGRKTWESLPVKYQPLPARENIVLTTSFWSVYPAPVDIWSSIDKLLDFKEYEDLYVIGGKQIYEEFLRRNVVDKIIASEIKGVYEGDTYFPQIGYEWSRKTINQNEEFDVVEFTKAVAVYE